MEKPFEGLSNLFNAREKQDIVKSGGMINVEKLIDDGFFPGKWFIVWRTKTGIDLGYSPDVVCATEIAKGLNYALAHGWEPEVK